ncbi:hypothetical protein BEWA_028690 [Theileria equi strain WA]|uniref:Uncharacterized protein n=1 Tax=Theileria equi strain WA TaxID=1537102 RepID=L0AYQ6_THEEQ|nr:hypothetical protein BEWA_028690 [Theileria equi strain WA]AFZ80019.1 hypothetical protein BEWA_028690 [Theileria equi strain WA]|eukprot:XP_004829685.1 hypothetical protein BEWA_028690 [Theileria equi strain WA]
MFETSCMTSNKDIILILQKIFLSEYAQHLHKHVFETDSSYPVKIDYIVNVANDPRYIQYTFLSDATKILEATEDANRPINEIMSDSPVDETLEKRVVADLAASIGPDDHVGSQKALDGTQMVTDECNINVDAESKIKSSKPVDPKKRKISILEYFKAK